MELTSKQLEVINNIYRKCNYDKDLVAKRAEQWFNSTGSNLSAPGYMVNLGLLFSSFSRKEVYDLIISHVSTRPDEEKLSVAIPDGSGMFLTIVRSSKGHLMVGDKRYLYKSKLREHNSYVPGGITLRELQNSGLAWCLQFAERLENE